MPGMLADRCARAVASSWFQTAERRLTEVRDAPAALEAELGREPLVTRAEAPGRVP